MCTESKMYYLGALRFPGPINDYYSINKLKVIV